MCAKYISFLIEKTIYMLPVNYNISRGHKSIEVIVIIQNFNIPVHVTLYTITAGH